MDFIVTAFDIDAVDFLEKLEVDVESPGSFSEPWINMNKIYGENEFEKG